MAAKFPNSSEAPYIVECLLCVNLASKPEKVTDGTARTLTKSDIAMVTSKTKHGLVSEMNSVLHEVDEFMKDLKNRKTILRNRKNVKKILRKRLACTR